MFLSLEHAIIFDIETFPNCFSFHFEMLNSDYNATFEISEFRDDRQKLFEFLTWCKEAQIPMIGFNNIHFDYPVIHYIYFNPTCTVNQIYEKAMEIINSFDNRFAHTIWPDSRIAPQIDLFKINHFDNKAKSTSLKALQINMRAESVVDMPVEVGTHLHPHQINNLLIPYNKHDVTETKRFAKFNKEAINFRLDQIENFGLDVLNWPDTKIGSRMMEQRLGANLCYDFSSGRRKMRQSPRTRIAVNDIIFPYIQFEHPEFNRVLNYLRGQVLTAQDLDEKSGEETTNIQTKGVFSNLKATIDGFEFYFGTGGIHGSISAQRVIATDEWLIRDIDVASLYPSIAIVNNLYPEHLGARFAEVYAQLPQERKEWQKKKGKKCVEANALKLASNGVYGNSNNKYSVFYDPKYTMTITINGQLMLCMLAEKLLKVPTLKPIQINTDGFTYFIHKDYLEQAKAIEKEWEALTKLTLEDASYTRMFIRDVNNYIAEYEEYDKEKKQTFTKHKLKGAYWSPDPLNYENSVSQQQPPAWSKDLGNCVSIRAAFAYMIHGVDPETFIRLTTNPYDFMCRIKVNRSDKLMYNGNQVQRNTRYYVSTTGAELVKIAPATGKPGTYKKANGIPEEEYLRVMTETNWEWDVRVCTKNKSVHEDRKTSIQAGHLVTICNDVRDFKFENLNYDFYINEARKLII